MIKTRWRLPGKVTACCSLDSIKLKKTDIFAKRKFILNFRCCIMGCVKRNDKINLFGKIGPIL